MNLLDTRLLRLARPVRSGLILNVLLGLAAGILVVLQARYLSLTVDAVFLGGASLADVQPLLLLLLAIALARALFLWAGQVVSSRVAARVKADLRETLLEFVFALGPVYARRQRTGELANTAVEGVESLDAYFGRYLPQLALAALVPLAILIFVFPLDVISGLVLLLTAPLIPIFMILIGNQADAMTRRQWIALSRMSAHFLDVLQGLPTLKMFNRGREQARIIAGISDQHRAATMGVLRVAFLSALVLELVATLSTAMVAVEIGLRLLYARLTFQQAFFVLILAPEFYRPLRLLGARFHAGIAGATAAKRIFAILGARSSREARHESRRPKPATGEPTDGMTGDIRFAAHRQEPPTVRFEQVSYAYDEGARPALKGVSFEVPAGKLVALVGPSGSGKSTVANLLMRFIEPTGGVISLDDRPLGEIAAEAWRSQVAWVPQRPYLFNETVAENIRLARPDASMAEIVEAARDARAHEFILALPDGYNTVLGEQGARLSGGQAQRIALARAFLKNAPFLILDEATSNLDPLREAEVSDAIQRLAAGRTALIIAHRLNTIRQADQIIVLNGGRVIESGSHRCLWAAGGTYASIIGDQTPGDDRSLTSEPEFAIGGSPAPMPGTAGPVIAEARSTGARSPQAVAPYSSSLVSRLQAFRHLLSLLAPFWPRVVLAVLLGFATIGSSIGLLAASAWIIASAALHPSIAALQVAIVGVRFFGITRGLFRYAERLASHQVTFRVLARLRVWFYNALEPLAPARLIAHRSGDLLSRVIADVAILENFYIRAIAPPVVALLILVLMTLLLSSFHPGLIPGYLTCYLLAAAGVPLLTGWLGREVGRELQVARGELNAVLVDGIQAIGDVLAFNRERVHLAELARLNKLLARGQDRMAAITGLNDALANLLAMLAVLATLCAAIPLVGGGRLAGVGLAVLVLAVIASFEAVLPLPSSAQYLESSLAAAQRLMEVVGGTGQEVRNRCQGSDASDQGAGVRGQWQREGGRRTGVAADAHRGRSLGMVAESLSFRYGPGERLALDEVSFAVPAGGRLAVVGPSGAGKSTLVNLLLRFWEPQSGDIWLGGYRLRDLPGEQVRSVISIVAQNTHLFNATVRANLMLARPGASEAEMVAAAQDAQLHEFILSLPDGYDTWIGEQGLRLSGGQRQRLAIARALLRNAPLLVLDEPTANLDPVTERSVTAAIRRLMAGRTTLIITHRLATLDPDDQILVLDAGRVVECGRHEALLARRGLYWQMWRAESQARLVV